MQKRRHEIDIHKDMLRAQIKSSEEERQTVRYSSGGRTGEGKWQPLSLGGIRVFKERRFWLTLDNRKWTVFPFKLVNAQGYPKGFCDWFWYANVSLAHFELTEIGSSVPIRTGCPTWKRHGSLLPKGAWVVHAFTHPHEKIKHLCLSSLFTGLYDLS